VFAIEHVFILLPRRQVALADAIPHSCILTSPLPFTSYSTRGNGKLPR
jgi:hypothetical protein